MSLLKTLRSYDFKNEYSSYMEKSVNTVQYLKCKIFPQDAAKL